MDNENETHETGIDRQVRKTELNNFHLDHIYVILFLSPDWNCPHIYCQKSGQLSHQVNA